MRVSRKCAPRDDYSPPDDLYRARALVCFGPHVFERAAEPPLWSLSASSCGRWRNLAPRAIKPRLVPISNWTCHLRRPQTSERASERASERTNNSRHATHSERDSERGATTTSKSCSLSRFLHHAPLPISSGIARPKPSPRPSRLNLASLNGSLRHSARSSSDSSRTSS